MPSFNQYMHSRNPYKEKTDFADLAAQYSSLQSFLIPSAHDDSKVTIDFSNPVALRTLTQALFKCHWALHVELPSDRLIPAIPQRLNYILWLEDLINGLIDINYTDGESQRITGIDIGTGASCVFPLLICRRNPSWHMLALESDAVSAQVAHSNITVNQLEERIALVETSDCLSHLRRDKLQKQQASSVDIVNIPHFHFTICNPPFFVSSAQESIADSVNEIQIEEQGDFDGASDGNDESRSSLGDSMVIREVTQAKGSGQRRGHKSQRCKSSGNTSCDSESITSGGEVQFVKRLIAQSVEIADSIDLFTVMLGSKESLIVLKKELARYKGENDQLTFNWTQFCQGRVLRWGLVWSFTRNLNSPSVERICSHKLTKKANEYAIELPRDVIAPGLDLVAGWTDLLVDLLLHSLNIKTFQITKLTPYMSIVVVKSNVNTWSHQRRKRRQLQREQEQAQEQSSRKNQPNGHQSHPQHVEDTQQDEMLLTTMQGTPVTVDGPAKASESINSSHASDLSMETVESIPESQLTSTLPDDNKCLSTQLSCCKRKVDEMNSLDCQVDEFDGTMTSSERRESETKEDLPHSQMEQPLHSQDDEKQVKMHELLHPSNPNVLKSDNDYLRKLPIIKATEEATETAQVSSDLSGGSLHNDQSYKKSRDVNSRQSMSSASSKGQSFVQSLKSAKHHTRSVQSEKADDILYLLHCKVKIVKAIDSSVKLIVVNNENSLHHESSYQLFQYVKNRFSSSFSSSK